MRIVITGATGQLGRVLCQRWAHETVIPKDLPNFDLSGEGIDRQIIEAGPDLIIHAGAYTDVDGAERAPDHVYAVNVGGTDQVARAAAQVGARLIYLSTDYVFDGTSRVPYREEDMPHPLNYYGLSKWKGEQAVLQSGAKALIVRTAWLYGHGGKNFVNAIMQAAYREPLLKVVNDQTGTPTLVEDLASAIDFLISKNVEGVVHMTNRGQCTWYDFAVSIVYEMGLSVPVVPITTEACGRLAQRPRYSVLNQDRLSSLGFIPPSWQESLKRFMSMGMVSLVSSSR